MRITRLFRNWMCAAAALVLWAAPARGAVDMFIKIGDLKGESRDKQHAGESDVLSWSWGMSNPARIVVGGGSGAGKVRISDLNFQKFTDTASTELMKSCANGKHYDRAVLTIRKVATTPIEFYRIILEEVQVTSVSTGGSEGSDELVESVTLSFARIGVQYFSITSKGTVGVETRFMWDLQQNLPGHVLFPGDSTGPQDSDGDGMPDDWETAHNLSPLIPDGNVDSDGDGATNFDEYVAGTDPQSKNEVFKASFNGGVSGAVGSLSWSSAPGKQYRILVSESLDLPFQLYSTVNSSGEGTTSIPFPANLGKQFFKIEVTP